MKRNLFSIVCISLISAGFVKADVSDKNAQLVQAETSGGLDFNDWGISFTPPEKWQRWGSDKETAFAAQALKSVDDASIKVQLNRLAGWSVADDSAAMLVIVMRERDGVALQLSDILSRMDRDDNRAKEYGDATQINRLEIGKVGDHACVLHDVTLRGGGRMLEYAFISGPEQYTVQWMFRDAARFAELKPAVDGLLQTISIDGDKQYMVALMRPAETGDTYLMQATCRQTERIKRIRDGQEEGQKNIEYYLELEADVRILEVDTTGYVTKFSLSKINFIETQDEDKTTLIPKDSNVMGYIDDTGMEFTINGNPVSPEIFQLLAAVIQLGKGGRWSDDEIFDSEELQKVGDAWKINSAVAAKHLAKTGINVQMDAITGTATLEEVTKIEDAPCLKVQGEMHIEEMSTPSIPDFEIETAEMHIAYAATFPVDITKGRFYESQEMRMTCSMRGKPDTNLSGVIVQSTAERTLTTKMTYPK